MFIEEWKGLQRIGGERSTTTFFRSFVSGQDTNTRFKGVPYSSLMEQQTDLSKTGDYYRYLTKRLHYQYKGGDL